jgi:DNA polymerase-3 subunit epsilon
MEFAADFTAIDFETASRRSDSACQLGLVTVRQGRIVDQACWLIRPKPLYFHRANIEIHGITPQQVRNQPEFGELWPEISAKIGTDCLVAHNASFDLRVLIASLSAHGQPIPELLFTCTRAIARRTWPHHRRYGLKPLSNWLGIRFQHHDALEDSIACSKILLAAGIDREAKSLPDLEKRLRLRRGKAGDWGLRGPTASGRSRRTTETTSAVSNGGLPFWLPNQVSGGRNSSRQVTGRHTAAGSTADRPGGIGERSPAEIDVQRLMIRAEFIRPLAGKQIVLTGRFRVLSQEDARSLAVCSGATCQESIDDSTDFLVIGNHRQRTPPLGEPAQDPASLENLATLRRNGGQSIRVVSEDEFIGLVGSPASAR